MSSAICREGDITLEGKKHHVVLLDYNSNGRFDDEMKISPDIHLSGGGVYAQQGDMLLIDPNVNRPVLGAVFDANGSSYPYLRFDLTKIVAIDGQLYDVKVSPSGDQLTMTKSTAKMGSVKNHNESFSAMIYGDKGFFKIGGTKDKPVAVPEGDWKLYNYTITSTEPLKPAAKADDANSAKPKTGGSLLDVLGAIVGISSGGGIALVNGPSVVSATATEGYKPVTVRAGETIELPFGGPYTPKVEARNAGGSPDGRSKLLQLSMTLVGASGEAVTSMTAHGNRPGKPAFTITDPDGKVVQQGDFEYG
jgi:hypothetical protein